MVRLATLDDLPALAALHKASFDAPWDVATLATFMQTDTVTVVGDPIRAMMITRVILDEAEIITLASALQQRRGGLARALLSDTASRLRRRGVAKIYLEVAANNFQALGLYRSAGFTQVGVRQDYYLNKDGLYSDALVLACQLGKGEIVTNG
jgi:[ribosomal protein S18]-alanine N-acetyltransferase